MKIEVRLTVVTKVIRKKKCCRKTDDKRKPPQATPAFPVAISFPLQRLYMSYIDMFKGVETIPSPTNVQKLCHILGKTSWPELVGDEGESAVKIIEKENTLVDAKIIAEGTKIIDIYLCDRVLVWVNRKGIVVSTPIIG